MHEYCVLPSVPSRNTVQRKPERLLKEVQYTETSPGMFELGQFPVNRANALSNGFNNHTLAAKGLEQEIKNCERHFGAALVPEGYNDNNLRGHAMNFINRRPALRDHLPATGPIHPDVITLNLLLGRKLYNTDKDIAEQEELFRYNRRSRVF